MRKSNITENTTPINIRRFADCHKTKLTELSNRFDLNIEELIHQVCNIGLPIVEMQLAAQEQAMESIREETIGALRRRGARQRMTSREPSET